MFKVCLYYIYLSLLSLFIAPCFCDILVIKNGSNNTMEIIGDLPALFGPTIPPGGLKGLVVLPFPYDACIPPSKPPEIPNYGGIFIALVKRYNCTFVDKVLNSQVSGYHAVIVRNVGSNAVEVMSGNRHTELVKIPSVFIGQDDGLFIQDNFLYNSGYHVVITDDLPFNIQNYLLPFAITIGICLILMAAIMLVKCIRDYKKTRRHRLSYRALRKLPTHKFKKGDPYDCCAVCLEDYVDNDKLRILPCSHAYHSKCIDPWLTKNRRVCPVCKRKVLTGDERPSDLETDSEDETAPLLNSEAGGTTQGGTFTEQRENPFQEASRRVFRQRNSSARGGNFTRLEEEDSSDLSDSDADSHETVRRVREVHSDAGTNTQPIADDEEGEIFVSATSTTDNNGIDNGSSSTTEQQTEVAVVQPDLPTSETHSSNDDHQGEPYVV